MPEKKVTPLDESTEKMPNKRVLEDWEMLQPEETGPIKIPYWLITLVVGLIVGAVLLSFPFLGVREGFERPWFDWGILVGIGYGVAMLAVIYFFMKRAKKSDS